MSESKLGSSKLNLICNHQDNRNDIRVSDFLLRFKLNFSIVVTNKSCKPTTSKNICVLVNSLGSGNHLNIHLSGDSYS